MGIKHSTPSHPAIGLKFLPWDLLSRKSLHFTTSRTDTTNQIIRNAQTMLELETQKAESDRRLREVENARRVIPPPPPRTPSPPPQVVPIVENPAPAPIPTPPPQPKIVIQSPPASPPQPAVQPVQNSLPPFLQPAALTRVQPANPFQPAQSFSQPSPPPTQSVAPPRIEIPKTAVIDPRQSFRTRSADTNSSVRLPSNTRRRCSQSSIIIARKDIDNEADPSTFDAHGHKRRRSTPSLWLKSLSLDLLSRRLVHFPMQRIHAREMLKIIFFDGVILMAIIQLVIRYREYTRSQEVEGQLLKAKRVIRKADKSTKLLGHELATSQERRVELICTHRGREQRLLHMQRITGQEELQERIEAGNVQNEVENLHGKLSMEVIEGEEREEGEEGDVKLVQSNKLG